MDNISDANSNYKTVPCKHFTIMGICQFGKRCKFKHGIDDTGNRPLPLDEKKSSSNYKTVPCKRWAQSGNCSFGEKCCFMHGEFDYKGGLFQKPYKRVQCKFFAMAGYCEKGDACGFIHGGEAEREFNRRLPSPANQRLDPLRSANSINLKTMMCKI